ncbi:BrxA family protein [Sorangium sp. So ce295]|uniref:BrxA family protein n=1 Tax=Sorangium sp. So ce295 TaxID=3133295 RepID=UPI003F628109
MPAASRASVVSSFTIIKGAMIEESYAYLAQWEFGGPKTENLGQFKMGNFVGARTQQWLRDVAFVMSRRFEPEGRDRPLVLLAKAGCDLEVWKPLLLWHITRDEFLLRDFLVGWLFPAFESGAYRIRPEDLRQYLLGIPKRGGVTEHVWSEATLKRVAAGLLKIAADFGLLKGSMAREFASYHLPEESFLYLLHAMRDVEQSPRKVIDSPDWRMFLMRPADVEHELLRLHQYRKVGYEVAGSLVELRLPCASSREYAERMVA